MSALLDLGALRRQVADLLTEMGLAERERALCTCDNVAPMRAELFAIRELATKMHASALEAVASATVVEALVHAKTGTSALKLEKLAAAAIVVADKVIEERELARLAKADQPVLNLDLPSSRLAGRGRGDRR